MEPVTRSTGMGSWAERYGQQRRAGVRGVAVRLGTLGALGLATLAGLGLAPATARAQAAGQSLSFAYVSPPGSGGCNQNAPPGPTTAASCPAITFPGGVGSATTASDNALRTASASATVTRTGSGGTALARGESYQASALTVTGTPSAGERLLFHFLTTQSATAAGGSATSGGSGFWQLYLLNVGGTSADAYQYAYANGSPSSLGLINATKTGTGFDLTLPFTPGSMFSYYFLVRVQGYGLTQGTTLSGSITAYLQDIDAQTANGMFISSASFDPLTGLGTISATPTSTVPEPGTLALLGTGIVGLVPLIRRRRF